MPFNLVLIFWFLTPMVESSPTSFIIVASEKSALDSITEFQLRNLYLGKLESIKSNPCLPAGVAKRLPENQQFITWLFGSSFNWGNYWAEQSVRGMRHEPIPLGSFALLLAFLERNHDYVGYLPSSLKDELKNFDVKSIKINR